MPLINFDAKFLALLSILGLIAPPVAAQNLPVDRDLTCKFHHAVQEFATFDHMPAMVREILRTHQSREGRFVRAAEFKDRWFVADNTDDKAYPRMVFGFALPNGPTRPLMLLITNYDQGKFCETVDDELDGRREIFPSPSEDITCAFRHAVQGVASFERMPAPIVRIVEAHLGKLAGRDKYFNHIDVLSPGDDQYPWHRFIRGGKSGDRWFVALESGGVAYERTVVFFALTTAGAAPRVPLHFGYYRINLCQAVDAALDGKFAARTYIDQRW